MKIRLIVVSVLISLFGIGSFNSALGFDQEEAMIHGFLGQGYIKSSNNSYLGDSRDGSYEYNEFGVNFLLPATDDLRLGVQFFSRDLGDQGNNDLTVDWALLDYYWKSWLGFRAGKVKIPFGLYNRSRDVDNLRTATLLNQAVYMEGFRDMVVAIYGFNLYGSKTFGPLGTINYDLFGGTMDIPKSSAFISNFIDRFTAGNPAFAGIFIVSDMSMRVKHCEGGQLLWDTPLSGFSLSYTDLSSKIETTIGNMVLQTDMKGFRVISMKYDIKNLSLTAEWMKAKFGSLYSGVDIGLSFDGWYAEMSYKMADWLHLGVSYGEYYPDSHDKKGRKLKGVGVRDYFAWQKDTTFSTKFNLNEYISFKFETHYIDGLGLTSYSDNISGDVKEHWFLYVFKTSINL